MMENNKKLHLGCGSVRFDQWINIDLDSPVADIRLDLTETLPFADGSVTHIFNEHFIEHVTRSQAVNFLRECYRVLSKNGVIRITTPNLRFLISTYLAGDIDEWGELWKPNTRCLMMNEGMRSWGHEFVYDAEELVRILVESGFNSISFQSYRGSQDQVLCGLESRPFHNELIVEARKIDGLSRDVDFSLITINENQWLERLSSTAPDIVTFERALIDQRIKSRRFEVESSARAQVIEDQVVHIRTVEEESSARGKVIEEQVLHIRSVEDESSARRQVIEDQTVHIRRVEEESAARLQIIEEQVVHICKVEEESSARVQVIANLEQVLEEQVSYGLKIEAELAAFRLSWYGKLKSFFTKFDFKNIDVR
jgi:predicted SAM-dependent methyltransferase